MTFAETVNRFKYRKCMSPSPEFALAMHDFQLNRVALKQHHIRDANVFAVLLLQPVVIQCQYHRVLVGYSTKTTSTRYNFGVS